MVLNRCIFSMRKVVGEFPNYAVCDNGEVINLLTNRSLVMSANNNGYLSVRLCKNNSHTQRRFLLHRLVLSTFTGFDIANPVTDHKDDNPANNNLTNLVWTTQSKNIQKSYDLCRSKTPNAGKGKFGAKHSNSKPIAGYDSAGNEIIRFESMNLARAAGYHVSNAIYGYRKTCKGLTFKYI